MNLQDAIRGRRSVRAFEERAIPEAAMRQIVDAAVQAPSAMNTQPWTFTIVQDRSVIDTIAAAAKDHIMQTVKADHGSSHILDLLSTPGFHVFYHAPAVAIISGPASNEWSAINCALAAQNLMLAAFEAGLGSCWIGFAQAWLNTPAGREQLGLTDEYQIVAPLALGYPKGDLHPVPRKAPQIQWI